MPETTNFSLYQPVAGESGWAAALNGNFDTIDALLYSHQTSIDGHTGTGSNKHNAEQIRTSDGSDVQSALAAKASLHHSHQADDVILPDNLDIGHHIANINDDIQSLETTKAALRHTHQSDDILLPDGLELGQHIDSIDDDIEALQTGKADATHEHAEYALQTALDTVENTLDLLLPDLASVTLSVDVVNRSGGIRILFHTTPTVHFSQAEILIEKDGVEMHHETVLSTYVFIDGSELSGVENGDVINLSVTLYSSLSSKIKKVDHTYATTTSPLEERIKAIETQLTLGNIIDAFAQDEDALQALANVLHSSNTLAQKVSELM